MADATGAGGYYPPGGGYGPGYGPGCGMSLCDRLQGCVGRVITVYVGEENVPVAGTLHAVGSNFLEIHRTTPENTVHEAVIIPLPAVASVVIPLQQPMTMSSSAAPGK
ncbi:hypothetical protein SAMN05660649_03454 [Desulfotomaculum arcticum]|uniref:Uncharacterized protein n=1 Tax=Desulfotruncus arcticus DSM 17038 TaxID=1121424 RepID=A0A1I2WFV0_9FIRM|nr:hypothetical protein [Desulfotruncus arcticus]SFG99619.1 hypothetical protein SAMN05660649_03454 [Desulfotomaculum arcticum] [Desulfotruncus arcticus DSM 17038]